MASAAHAQPLGNSTCITVRVRQCRYQLKLSDFQGGGGSQSSLLLDHDQAVLSMPRKPSTGDGGTSLHTCSRSSLLIRAAPPAMAPYHLAFEPGARRGQWLHSLLSVWHGRHGLAVRWCGLWAGTGAAVKWPWAAGVCGEAEASRLGPSTKSPSGGGRVPSQVAAVKVEGVCVCEVQGHWQRGPRHVEAGGVARKACLTGMRHTFAAHPRYSQLPLKGNRPAPQP